MLAPILSSISFIRQVEDSRGLPKIELLDGTHLRCFLKTAFRCHEIEPASCLMWVAESADHTVCRMHESGAWGRILKNVNNSLPFYFPEVNLGGGDFEAMPR